jgi:hypothetical protein
MELPEGTLYCKGSSHYFTELCVKGCTFKDGEGNDIDWISRDLMSCDSMSDSFEEMGLFGTKGHLNDAYCRDGCFDDSDVFLVYEHEDLKQLQNVIIEAMEI